MVIPNKFSFPCFKINYFGILLILIGVINHYIARHIYDLDTIYTLDTVAIILMAAGVFIILISIMSQIRTNNNK